MAGGGDETLEAIVADTVVHLLGAAGWSQWDAPGSGDSRHDIDVHFDDGCVVAVEVTRITDHVRRRQTGSKRRYESESTLLRRQWRLDATRYDIDLRQLHTAIDPVLAELEALDVTSFPASADMELTGYEEAVKRLYDAGFMSGESSAARAGQPGSVDVNDVVVGMTNVGEFTTKVQAQVDANHSKLQPADRVGSLLAIWVDSQTWAGQAPMSHSGFLPDAPLTMPAECAGVIVLREEFPFQPRTDRAWTYGAPAWSLLPPGWADLSAQLELHPR